MKRVLIVDDTIRALRDAESAVKSLGYETVTARSAAEGLNILLDGGIDLAIIDYGMPQTDGIQMVGKMRANKDQTPVIICSTLIPEMSRNIAAIFGVRDYIEKDLRSERARKAIVRILGEAKTQEGET